LKAQIRLKQLEEERNARKQAWQNFLQQGQTPLYIDISSSIFQSFIVSLSHSRSIITNNNNIIIIILIGCEMLLQA
jgi:hypothetical protein